MEKNTILIVDDFEFNRTILSELFPDYTIMEAENGFKAIEEYEKHKDEICAVLSDLMMPVLDGFGLLDYFFKNKYVEKVPVFIISADSSTKALAKAYDMGAQDVINKPFNVKFLRRRIENIIELFRLREIVNASMDDDEDFLDDEFV
ncbi:MAG: response regulator [Oscillospiraceae bacterium]|nr:response regulator [Oscillospiraceae bacterium]